MLSQIVSRNAVDRLKFKRALVALRMFGVHAMEHIPGRPLLHRYRGGSAI